MVDLRNEQIAFYKKAFKKFGDDPRAVHYNTSLSQRVRFDNIFKLFMGKHNDHFSIHEVGCGLAHMKEYLDLLGIKCDYSGSDITKEFIDLSKNKFSNCSFFLHDITDELNSIPELMKFKDYYVLSGTFNPIGNIAINKWESFIFRAISNMFKLCNRGIAFNFLTIYSDFYNEKLYYSDPKIIYEWCQKNLSRFVSICSDIPLYEFTVLVYKKEYIKSQYNDEFLKYF